MYMCLFSPALSALITSFCKVGMLHVVPIRIAKSNLYNYNA